MVPLVHALPPSKLILVIWIMSTLMLAIATLWRLYVHPYTRYRTTTQLFTVRLPLNFYFGLANSTPIQLVVFSTFLRTRMVYVCIYVYIYTYYVARGFVFYTS